MLRLGVLASGSGTNLQAILDACAAKRIDAEVVVVCSDRRDAHALGRARARRVPAHVVDVPPAMREERDAHMTDHLEDADVQLVCLAGYMRIVTPVLLRAFPDRVVNIHPALLPSFPGLQAQRQAMEHGVKITGCTTHLVDEQVDHGPILMQAAVPILEDDTEEAIQMRILAQEHILYPATIQLFAEDRVRVEGRVARIRPRKAASGAEALRNPPV
ncbi:MAG TPA: phosphoribosylglycinamide formyltransferase [Candidatus Thermoplasmatota archaeon]|jgi:phosphoribosylglycinamide formyltransferase-1|nr:phosphoribosylglycinamide formyltransferase [Candidatus Thermoplasmatota archaeon]